MIHCIYGWQARSQRKFCPIYLELIQLLNVSIYPLPYPFIWLKRLCENFTFGCKKVAKILISSTNITLIIYSAKYKIISGNFSIFEVTFILPSQTLYDSLNVFGITLLLAIAVLYTCMEDMAEKNKYDFKDTEFARSNCIID